MYIILYVVSSFLSYKYRLYNYCVIPVYHFHLFAVGVYT